jgi:hypothetical protein
MTALGILAALALVWDVALAGAVAQSRVAPRALAGLSGLIALLVLPAAVVLIAGSGGIGSEGRTLWGAAWIWPAAVALCAAQAVYVTLRRLTTPILGLPIVAYDLLLLVVAAVRYVAEDGGSLPPWALTLGAAYSAALGRLAGRAALASPYAFLAPIVVPTLRVRWSASRPLRVAAALVAAALVGLLVAAVPDARRAIASYAVARTAVAGGVLPATALIVGLHILPPVSLTPPSLAVRNDLALADSLQVAAIGVTIEVRGARRAILDSLGRALESLRRDSTLLVVDTRAGGRASDSARMQAVVRIARTLHPDYLLPGGGGDALSRTRELAAAAAAVHRADPHIRVAVSLARFDARDSALFEWAAQPASPLDAVGFAIFPGFDGMLSLEAHLRTAERWMSRYPAREYWVFAAGAYPIAHGEMSQARVLAAVLAWAAAHPGVRGVLIAQGGDYGWRTGLRAPTGRLRPAVDTLARLAHALRSDTARD